MPNINARQIRFSLCSFCLHLALFWLFLQANPFTYGAAGKQGNMESASQMLTVKILSNETAQLPTSQKKDSDALFRMISKDSVAAKARPTLFQSTESSDLITDERRHGSTSQTNLPQDLKLTTASVPDYFPAGRLTRLPFPVTDIDLDVVAINGPVFTGEIELSVLIDENGTVTDVLSATESEDMKTLVDRVAERFKSAHFIAGEINGRAVKSRLQIVVVSESLSDKEID